MRAWFTMLTLGALLAVAAPARADTSEAVKAFDEGRKLRDERLFDLAAKAFERSLALEKSIGAHFNLGFCYDQLSRPYDALAAYRSAANLARERNDPRLGDANSAIQKLLESHDHVVLVTPAEVMKVPGLHVEVDKHPVPEDRLNGELFSAGTLHTVTVDAAGHARARSSPNLKNGERFTVVLGPTRVEPGAPWGWQKWTGVGLVGAGVVTASVGLFLALDYYSEQKQLQSDLTAFCNAQPNGKCGPGSAGVATYFKRAEDLDSTSVTRNVIVFGAAGALVVGGAVLFFTAPSPAKEKAPAATVRVLPHVGERDTGLSLIGTF